MDRAYVMSLVRSFELGHLTRREFVTRATIALGSLATANLVLSACSPSSGVEATAPASPEEQPTPIDGETAGPTDVAEEPAMEAGEMVEYPAEDGAPLMGYLALPEAQPAPAVVVIQEWWGLNEHIKAVTRRFADAGYAALAPDLYHGQVVDEPNEAQKLVMELDQENAVAEIRQAIDFLQGHPAVSGPRVGGVGFCMGGGLVLQTALAEPDLGAAVAFYGRPLDPSQAANVQAPVLGLYGADDQGIAVGDVEAMEDGLEDSPHPAEVHVYEGAGHAFFNDTRDSYHEEAAQDAWDRTLGWFQQHLGA